MKPEPAKSATKRILVVDDDHDVLQVVKRRLETFHYEVLKASNGQDGLRIAEEQQPDLILLDIMMPGMKGRDVCLKLKANSSTAHIPVIFLTALGLADHIKAGMDAGAEDYVVKPYAPEQLRERIMVCLARHDGGG